MLTVHHLAKAFDLDPLFENVTFSINSGDRVGLIGPNGCGKTTLLRLMTGAETADAGHVACDPGVRVGYLAQGFELDPHTTLGDLTGRAAGSIASLEEELAGLAQALVRQPDNASLQLRYDTLLQRISRADVGRAAAILDGLGLAALAPDIPVVRLSGGQKTRLLLALVLLDEPDLLLLDEPTNHLDIEMLEWLEAWLAQFEGGALIVSHDRTFLDRTVTRILDMDPRRRAVREYAGSYTDYLAQKTAEREKQWAAYKDQQQEIRRVKEDIARVRAQAAYTERQASSVRIGGGMMALKGYKDYQRTIAKKVAKKAKARAKKLERYLDDAERVEKPERTWQLKLDFDDADHLGKWVLEANGLNVGYGGYAPLLRDLRLEVQAGERIVLTGPNGAGKTTLLRTIAGTLPPLAGELRLGGSVRLGYMTQEQTSLDPARTPLTTIQPAFSSETDARTFLSYFLFVDDEPLKPNALLSYGQRARLMLALLIAEGCNFLLLDEPINHLDIPSRTQFEQALAHFKGTVLAVVHDRYFIDRFATEVWWVEGRGIRRS
jgi:ATP-binding cassette, subfamily F, member 3